MGRLIRYCKLTEEHVGDNCFDVSRCGILGNPYTHIKDRSTKAQIKVKSREIAIDMYKAYFNAMMESDDKSAKPFQNEFNRIMEAYKKYPEVYIGCFCHTDEPCHGDFIIEEVVRRSVLDLIKNKQKKQIT